ncbi:MAG: DNA gyrase inhibitor YacG [Planctomycetes bacterium]|nr:DNA gyrase inhibitor YacG [Planctomycetota bacterium]
MTETKCPICKQGIRFEGEDEPEDFPFCSERCRLVDLGIWLAEGYTIEGGGAAADDLPDDSLGG